MKLVRYIIAKDAADFADDVAFGAYEPEWEDRQQIQRDRGPGEKIFRVTVEEATPEELNAPPGTTV